MCIRDRLYVLIIPNSEKVFIDGIKKEKGITKDYTICLSLCGRGEKDLDTIQQHIGKDFEWKT